MRRPDPRVGVALAGAGCALAVVGVLAISGDALPGIDGDDGGGSQVPGILLSAALFAAGLGLLVKAPPGAFRTAGSVATVASIPALLFFLTFDDGAFPPYSPDAILGVSAAAWVVLHLVGPAAGRTFPLGAGLLGAWLFLLQITEDAFTSPLDLLWFIFVGFLFVAEEDGAFFFGGNGINSETLAAISLAFGAAMVVVGHRLDRAGDRGRATAFVVAAIAMLPAGALLFGSELELAGSGLLLAVIGVALSANAAVRGRRFTTWAGALFTVVGIGMLLGDVAGDNVTGFGVAAIIAGAGLVATAHFATAALGEPDELEPGPSILRPPQAVVPSSGATPPDGPPDAPPDEPSPFEP